MNQLTAQEKNMQYGDIAIKPIPGHELKYGATADGKIFSYPRYRVPHGRFINGWINKYGYRTVKITLIKKDDEKNYLVHRLIAKTFLNNYSDDLCVNHIDGNKLNNSINNLEMVTSRENMIHAFKIGLVNNSGERCVSSKLSNSDVICIRELHALNNFNQKQLANIFEVSPMTISDVIRNKTFKDIL